MKKRPLSPVSPAKTRETAPPPGRLGKLDPHRMVLTAKEIFVAAPVDSCFGLLASQLEQRASWDPIIVSTQPVSLRRGRIGATSQVTLNLGGRQLESLATIAKYRPNRALSWVLNKEPKVREDWRLEPYPYGTMVGVRLAYEVPGWPIGRLLYRIIRWKKVKQDLNTMLTQLKAVVESINRDQMIGG